MNVLILHSDDAQVRKLAQSISDGAKEIKANVTLSVIGKTNLDPQNVDFVFLGAVLAQGFDPAAQKALSTLSKKNAAFFFVGNRNDLKTIEALCAQAKKVGVVVQGSFCALREGPLTFLGMGPVRESDLIRARGFGERTLNNAFGLAFGGESEKAKIKGYLK